MPCYWRGSSQSLPPFPRSTRERKRGQAHTPTRPKTPHTNGAQRPSRNERAPTTVLCWAAAAADACIFAIRAAASFCLLLLLAHAPAYGRGAQPLLRILAPVSPGRSGSRVRGADTARVLAPAKPQRVSSGWSHRVPCTGSCLRNAVGAQLAAHDRPGPSSRDSYLRGVGSSLGRLPT